MIPLHSMPLCRVGKGQPTPKYSPVLHYSAPFSSYHWSLILVFNIYTNFSIILLFCMLFYWNLHNRKVFFLLFKSHRIKTSMPLGVQPSEVCRWRPFLASSRFWCLQVSLASGYIVSISSFVVRLLPPPFCLLQMMLIFIPIRTLVSAFKANRINFLS